ncbi:M28 family peptidase [Candidatus Latescibacterota bacterium]
MKRRSFIKTGSLASMAAPFLHDISKAEAVALTGGLVDTIEVRYYYLKRMLYSLCTELGPRPAGSEAYNSGIRLIMNEMKRSLPEVFLDEFKIEKWELIDNPSLTVGGKAVEAFPFHGSIGTPKSGAMGILSKNDSGPPYSIIERTTGEKLADINISAYGPAIPSNAYRDGKMANIPIFGVGKYDRRFLDKAAEEKSPIIAKSNVKITKDVSSWNAVGTLTGKFEKEIVVIAHADTVYTSPGANDNTASVIVMLMMAHELSKTEHDYTLTFVATGSEEYALQGAYGYAKRRINEDTIKNIKYIIQFDSLTYGPDFLLTSEDKELREIVDSINSDLKINGKPRHIDSTAWVMDSLPLKSSGARAIYINSRGYDGITLPVYHRAEDIPETVGFDCVDNSFRVFTELVRHLQTI